ncbi:MAG: alanyl-tRNA editing protein, partial [Sphaerochaetaceae bacterium]|nr:alanyl-tRNA editing protein [Sphaerochaetaceae bacterium]
MEKVYYNEPYLQEIPVKVVSVTKNEKYLEVLTDKTIFYGEGGGQPGDIGSLGQWKVLDTKKTSSGDSVLYLPLNSLVEIGSELKLSLNWDYRYNFMVCHTAQHLLSGLLNNLFNIGTVAIHLSEQCKMVE